jgi:release factor glutamine methyltransferase
MSAIPSSLESLWRPPSRFGWQRMLGRALYWHHRLFWGARSESAALERVAGRPLVVLPGVMNPRLMRTGAFFASQLHGELTRDREVLDMGTGSGVCAIAAAQYARHVVAIDINPAAVRCAQINALLNGLEHKLDVLQGDLFAPVRGVRFELVLFNPPFLQGTPRSDADRAWRSTDVAERFAGSLGQHLRPTGFALVVLSSYGGAAEFIRQFDRAGLTIQLQAQRRYVNETVIIVRVAPESPAARDAAC